MDSRTLEARLTAKLFGLAGAVLVAVGAAAVIVTSRALDTSDTETACADAARERAAFDRELSEGDTPDDAVREIISESETGGVHLFISREGAMPWGARALAGLVAGDSATLVDGEGKPWRACATGNARRTIVTAIPIGAHRGVVRALSRGMLGVVVAALGALWLAVRRSLRAPLRELTVLVEWTGRIVNAEPAVDPPTAETREIAKLEAAFVALVRRLLDALARERANSAHIAHELRTPLTAMVAELDALLPGARSDEATGAALARVRGDAARLSDVIDAILVLSDDGARGARGKAVVNVADLAREVAPPDVRVDAPDEALVEADERLVWLALRNLADNARKYGDGVRLVRVSREGTSVRLAVIDNGPGIDEPARRLMFERSWRGSADGDGRGLGLALVRAVAQRHGGMAEAQPASSGGGLQVSMTLEGVIGWHDASPEGV